MAKPRNPPARTKPARPVSTRRGAAAQRRKPETLASDPSATARRTVARGRSSAAAGRAAPANHRSATARKPAERRALPPQGPVVWPYPQPRAAGERRYWLMKSEPEVFSIDHLAQKQRSPWDGVRSFMARNQMLGMAVGDLALFYHSSTEPPGVAGLARVVREAYPDHTQFDPNSQYYDPGATPEQPRWFMVEVEFVEKFERLISLDQLKADPALADMLVIRRGMRLSVQPVHVKHMRHILALAGASTSLM